MSKTQITLIIALLIAITNFAQNGINYKAIVKDNLGNVVANEQIDLQFIIGNGTTEIYGETHSPTTDANGLIILTIGEGTIIGGDDYTDIDWASDNHFLNVKIDTGSGFVDLGTTPFMKVPYALHAETAANVFSGNYDDLVDTPIITNPTGLELITENGNTGWRLLGQDPNSYGDIGDNAVDLSYYSFASTTGGATGTRSAAMGYATTASGYNSTAMGVSTKASDNFSTAMGNFTTASGNSSTAIGYETTASGDNSTAMGVVTTASGNNSTTMGTVTTASGYSSTAMGNNTTASADSSTAMGSYNIIDSNALLSLGSGNSNANRKNALTVLKNGKLYITPTHDDAALANASGYMILGQESGVNIVFDNNEIMARNNGVASTLYLNNDGGNVLVGGSIVQTSDYRLKKDITDLSYGLNEVLQLQPKAYNWKNREQDYKSLGLIAQEVQLIIKEVVTVQEDEDKTLGISYTELIPVLINAIKEQNKRIDELEARLNSEQHTVSTEKD